MVESDKSFSDMVLWGLLIFIAFILALVFALTSSK